MHSVGNSFGAFIGNDAGLTHFSRDRNGGAAVLANHAVLSLANFAPTATDTTGDPSTFHQNA